MKNKNLISVSGRIGSGKDTVAQMIINLNSEYKIKKFAGKLKQITSILTGADIGSLEDQEFKKKYIGDEWGMTYREFLQKIGTEGLRNGLHENVWVNALFADYVRSGYSLNIRLLQNENLLPIDLIKKIDDEYNSDWVLYAKKNNLKKGAISQVDRSKWIITDTRFKNELQAVQDRGGICIRLTRNDDVYSNHPSETDLDNITSWDWVIDNKSLSIEETRVEVSNMLEHFKII